MSQSFPPLADDDGDEEVSLDVAEPRAVQRQQHGLQAAAGGERHDVEVLHRRRVGHLHDP